MDEGSEEGFMKIIFLMLAIFSISASANEFFNTVLYLQDIDGHHRPAIYGKVELIDTFQNGFLLGGLAKGKENFLACEISFQIEKFPLSQEYIASVEILDKNSDHISKSSSASNFNYTVPQPRRLENLAAFLESNKGGVCTDARLKSLSFVLYRM
jgi:hypothetical protein